MTQEKVFPTVYDKYVSVVFIAEGSQTDYTFQVFRSVTEQIYKKIEYIIVHSLTFDIEAFQNSINEHTSLDISTPIQYIPVESSFDMVNAGIAAATSDIVFLKATNPTVWYPNHILTHLAKHKASKFKQSIVLSKYEIRDVRYPLENPMGSLGYRVTKKIKADTLFIDEISTTRDMVFDFSAYGVGLNAEGQEAKTPEEIVRTVFDNRKLYAHIIAKGRHVQFADEVSVVQLVQPQDNTAPEDQILTRPNWTQLNTVQAVTEDLELRHRLPTLFGNTQADSAWNDKVREWLRENWETMLKDPARRVVIKRTIGMGDVLSAEPVVRYFKEMGFEVWFVTGNTRSCKDIVSLFKATPDQIFTISEADLTTDVLGETNLPLLLKANGFDSPEDYPFDIRLDLDLAYESRLKTPFVQAYFETLGFEPALIETMNLVPELKAPALENDGIQHLAVCLAGSGWQGKELSVASVTLVLQQLKDAGHVLHHVSPLPEQYAVLVPMFESINTEESFTEMMESIFTSDGYVGADNGPMHVAIAYKKPVFVWNGAALTSITSASKDVVVLSKEDLACLGCKHEMFYNIIEFQPQQFARTFVPECTNDVKFDCMNGISDNHVKAKTEEFLLTVANTVNA